MYKVVTAIISFFLVFGIYFIFVFAYGEMEILHVFTLLAVWLGVCYVLLKNPVHFQEDHEMSKMQRALFYTRAFLFAVRLAVLALVIFVIFIVIIILFFKAILPFRMEDLFDLTSL